MVMIEPTEEENTQKQSNLTEAAAAAAAEDFETASEGEEEEGVDDEVEEQSGLTKDDPYEDALTDEQMKQRALDQANDAKAEGNKLFGAGKYEDALSQYEVALNVAPDMPSSVEVRSICHANRAACLSKLGKYEDTIKECTKALELNPTYVKALIRRGETHEKLEHFEEALADMKKILELDPSNDKARKSIQRLEPLAAEKREKMKEEMIDELAQFSQFTDQLSQFSMQPESNTRKTRGGNFTMEEDILLVKAWLNTSLELQGNEQKQKAYWTRMWEYFHKYKKFASDRSEKSLMSRWSQIHIATSKFCGCLDEIESRHQSGGDEHDKIANAKLLYQELNKDKRPFQFGHCWNILRHHQKWLEDRQKKTPTKKCKSTKSSPVISSPSTPMDLVENNVSFASFVELERPPGKEGEKDCLKKRKGKDCETACIAENNVSNASFAALDRAVGRKVEKDHLNKRNSKDQENDSIGENISNASFVDLEMPLQRNAEKDCLDKLKGKGHENDSIGEENVSNASFVALGRPAEGNVEKDRLNKRKRDRIKDSENSSVVAFLHEMREEKKQLRVKKMEMYERIYLQQQERLALDKEKHRLEQMKEDERIMLIDTKEMPPHLADYYERRQMEILARGCSNS